MRVRFDFIVVDCQMFGCHILPQEGSSLSLARCGGVKWIRGLNSQPSHTIWDGQAPEFLFTGDVDESTLSHRSRRDPGKQFSASRKFFASAISENVVNLSNELRALLVVGVSEPVFLCSHKNMTCASGL